jgi:allene oxide cyclase-like protein
MRGVTPEQAMGQRFTVIEHAPFTVVPVRASGAAVGDTAVFRSDLYDEANVTVVGAIQGFCVRTVLGVRMECVATASFADGMIMTQGPEDEALSDGAEISFAITGGTGAYLGAKGEVRITQLAGQDRQFTYAFALSEGWRRGSSVARGCSPRVPSIGGWRRSWNSGKSRAASSSRPSRVSSRRATCGES